MKTNRKSNSFTPSLLGKPASEPWMLTLSSISRTRHPTWDEHLDSQQTAHRTTEQNPLPVLCSKLRRIAYTHAGGHRAWHSPGWTLWRDAPFGRTGADATKCMCACFCSTTGSTRDPMLRANHSCLLFLICHINHATNTHSIVISCQWKRSCHRGTDDSIYLLDP